MDDFACDVQLRFFSDITSKLKPTTEEPIFKISLIVGFLKWTIEVSVKIVNI